MAGKKENNRTFLAIRNLVFSFGYQIINTVVNIVLPPLIIGYFGSVMNGFITTVKQIISYIQLVGAGISDSTVVSLYKPLGEGDKKKISSIYNAVGKTFNRSGAIFSLAALLVAFVYPFFIEEDLTYSFVVKIVLILSISGLSEFLFIGKYRTLLAADQQLYIVNIAQIVGALGSAGLTILMILLGANMIWVQLAAAVAYVLRVLILYVFIHKRYRYLDKSAEPDFSAVSKRGAATVHQIASLIILGSQTIFISNFCGLAEASVYSVYNLIFTGLNTILSTVSSAMLAGMGNLMAMDDHGKVKQIYGIYELLYYAVTFVCYITALVMIKPFIQLYTMGVSDVEYIRPELMILFTVMGLMNCLRTPGVTMILAKGHYAETRNRALLEMAICIGAQLLLIPMLGMAGAILGTIIAYLYRTTDIIFYSNKVILKQSPKETLLRVLRYGLLIAVIGTFALNIKMGISGYFSWILYAAVIALCALALVLGITVIFDRKVLIQGWSYVKTLLRKE